MSSPPRTPCRPSRFVEGEPLTGYPSATGPHFSDILSEQDLHEAVRRSRQGSSSAASSSSASSRSTYNTPQTHPSPPPKKTPRPESAAAAAPPPARGGVRRPVFGPEPGKTDGKPAADDDSSAASRSDRIKDRLREALARGREWRAPAATGARLPAHTR